jgi:polysaccharide deacetylase 2 family uncharacterized protein YibQ
MRRRSHRALVSFWLLLVAAAWTAGYSAAVWWNSRNAPESKSGADAGKKSISVVSEALKGENRVPVPSPVSSDRQPKKTDSRGLVAIIVDDMGTSVRIARELSSMTLPLTWSLIPGQPRSEAVALFAKEKGIPMMIHMPMEPVGNGYDRNFLVGVTTSPDVVHDEVRRIFLLYPWAIGMNNHMGSRATADAGTMRNLMKAMKGTGKFFVDSRTTSASVAVKEARDADIPVAASSVFLDHESTPEYMTTQCERMARIARKRGWVIAIIHPRPKSMKLLRQLAETPPDGVRFVTMPEIMDSENGPMRRLAP